MLGKRNENLYPSPYTKKGKPRRSLRTPTGQEASSAFWSCSEHRPQTKGVHPGFFVDNDAQKLGESHGPALLRLTGGRWEEGCWEAAHRAKGRPGAERRGGVGLKRARESRKKTGGGWRGKGGRWRRIEVLAQFLFLSIKNFYPSPPPPAPLHTTHSY